jgi:hypothetical protein
VREAGRRHLVFAYLTRDLAAGAVRCTDLGPALLDMFAGVTEVNFVRFWVQSISDFLTILN